jgi:hypothetical protein
MHCTNLEWVQNSDAVETEFLHLQPFTNSDYHFLIIVEFATSQVLLQV